jgi:multicomponent Na+:H+ antiporter subunit D
VNSLILVILVPFFSAVVLALLNGHPRLERAVNVASCAGLTVYVFWLLGYVDAYGIQTSMVGGYRAPYGIPLVADRLSCIMLCLSMAVGTVALLVSLPTLTAVQERYFFHPMFQLLLLGVNWSFVTGDLFNLFVAYEVMLVGSYGAMMAGASRAQVRQTLMYIAVNLVGGALFVVGLGLLYALVGTLNMADVAQRTAELTGPRAAAVTAASMLLLVVFALKAAIFPVFFWLPDSYPVVPAGVNGYFAGLLTKVGVYSLLRVFVMMFQQEGHELATQILLTLSGFTMLLGVLGALCQWEIRRVLSWHIISQVGYMVMGIGLASDAALARAAVAGTIFYVAHHIIVKSSLFMLAGVAELLTGARQLKQMGGIVAVAPGAALLFLIAAFSLAGMPPFSGFLSKLLLVQVGLQEGRWWIVAIAIATSFLTLLSMLKIWSYAFWGRPRRDATGVPWRAAAAPVSALVAATIALGLWGQPLLRLAGHAADEVTQPSAYVEAVLGPRALAAQRAIGMGRRPRPRNVKTSSAIQRAFGSLEIVDAVEMGRRPRPSNPQTWPAIQPAYGSVESVEAEAP